MLKNCHLQHQGQNHNENTNTVFQENTIFICKWLLFCSGPNVLTHWDLVAYNASYVDLLKNWKIGNKIQWNLSEDKDFLSKLYIMKMLSAEFLSHKYQGAYSVYISDSFTQWPLLWKHHKYLCFCILPLEFGDIFDFQKYSNISVLS